MPIVFNQGSFSITDHVNMRHLARCMCKDLFSFYSVLVRLGKTFDLL